MNAPTTEHIFLDKQHPALWRALNGLGLKVREAATGAGIDRRIIELLDVRISQINGCAYCLDMHVRDAVDNGETPQRLSVLQSWRDTALFTDRERAALALAESITELPDHRSREHEEGYAREHLSADEFSVISWLAITMNAFNRCPSPATILFPGRGNAVVRTGLPGLDGHYPQEIHTVNN